MLHKLYVQAFSMSEKEASRRIYYGFRGDEQAVENHHNEILYMKQFVEELKKNQ